MTNFRQFLWLGGSANLTEGSAEPARSILAEGSAEPARLGRSLSFSFLGPLLTELCVGTSDANSILGTYDGHGKRACIHR